MSERVAGNATEQAVAPGSGDPRLPSRASWRERLATIAAVSSGGLLGANGRYLVGRWASERWGEAFPWGTLLVNVAGSFVLGFFLTMTAERFPRRGTIRLFVATGFLGAFTTFSSFSYEVVRLVQDGEPLQAAIYVATSLLVGVGAGVAGVVAAHAL